MIVMLTLLLAIAPALPIFPTPTPVRVVFVNTDEGAFTAEYQAEIVSRVQRTLDYWHRLAPTPVYAVAEASSSLAVAGELAEWVESLYSTPHDEPTVYVVYNEQSRRPILDGLHGRAWSWLKWAAVTSAVPLGAEALTAHEIGHLLYHLPDLYPCGQTDIMCNPTSAYPHRLGCMTITLLGGACTYVRLPLIHLSGCLES